MDVLSNETCQPKYEYDIQVDYLGNGSLIDCWKRGNEVILKAHGLRTHFIREKKKVEVKIPAVQILGESLHREVEPSNSRDSVVVILGETHFAQPFRSLVATPFEDCTRG